MKLRKLLSLALVGAMTFSLAACGSSDDEGSDGKEKVSLVMWGAEEDQTMLREMADAFIEMHKDEADITIDIGVQSESNCKDNVLKDVEAAADVYSFPNDQINELVAAGALMAIPEEMNLQDVKDRNMPASVDAATVDGKVYAYPRTADNGFFLFYDKSVFSEEDVKSWETMLDVVAAAGKKITMEMNSGWYTYGFFKGAGLEVSLDGKNTLCDWNSTTNKIKGVDVAQAMLDICMHDGFIATEDAEFVTGIKEGTIVAGINGTWNASAAQEAWGDNYAATKLPTFKAGGEDLQMYSVTGCKLVGVNPNCKYAGWAMKLADYITNEENQVKSFELRGNGPSNIKAAASEEVQKNIAIAAFSLQQTWAEVQRVGANFWTPTETFGQILQDGNPDGTDLQTLLDNMVAGVTAPVQ